MSMYRWDCNDPSFCVRKKVSHYSTKATKFAFKGTRNRISVKKFLNQNQFYRISYIITVIFIDEAIRPKKSTYISDTINFQDVLFLTEFHQSIHENFIRF